MFCNTCHNEIISQVHPAACKVNMRRVCGSYNDFIDRGLLLTRKLLNQEFLVVLLISSLRNLYSFKLTRMYSICRKCNPFLSSFMTYHWGCNKSNTTGATRGAGTAYTSGTPMFTSDFSGLMLLNLQFSV